MPSVIVIKRNTLEIWRDVVFALFAREIRTGFNDKLGLSWAIVNPVAFIAVLSYLRAFISDGDTHSLETFTFMAIGVLFVMSFLQIFAKTAVSIKKNKALFAFRQVQPISAVIAALLFEVLVKIISLSAIVLVMYFIDVDVYVSNGLLFIISFACLMVLASAIGLLFGVGELFVSELSRLRELLTRPLFFISGTFFSLQDIPIEFWGYLNWNPILHAIELARYSVSEQYGSSGVSFSFLSGVTIVFLFGSLSVYFACWKKAISR